MINIQSYDQSAFVIFDFLFYKSVFKQFKLMAHSSTYHYGYLYRSSHFWLFPSSLLLLQATHTQLQLMDTQLQLMDTQLQLMDTQPQLTDTTPQPMVDMDMNNQNTTAQS